MGTAFIDFSDTVTLERVRMLREAAQQLLSLADELEAKNTSGAGYYEAELLLAETPMEKPNDFCNEAGNVYQMRRRRERYFPTDFFGEPAWDMLLDLYSRNGTGEPVSVSSACIAASVPPTTALRWLRLLEDRGFVQRSQHSNDSRVTLISLTEFGQRQLKLFLSSCD